MNEVRFREIAQEHALDDDGEGNLMRSAAWGEANRIHQQRGELVKAFIEQSSKLSTLSWREIKHDSSAPNLPDESVPVLIAHRWRDAANVVVSEAMLVSEHEMKWQLEATDAYNDHHEVYGRDVTHWMPLPEAPK
jgi:hypothetical protein